MTDAAAAARPGTAIDLNVCKGDDDFYAISADAGDEIVVDLLFRSLEGDIDLELQDGNGAVLARSMGIIGPETGTHVVPAAGTSGLGTVRLARIWRRGVHFVQSPHTR